MLWQRGYTAGKSLQLAVGQPFRADMKYVELTITCGAVRLESLTYVSIPTLLS